MRSYARAILRSNQMQVKPAMSIRKSDGSGVLIGGGGGGSGGVVAGGITPE